MKSLYQGLFSLGALLLTGCLGIPDSVVPVQDFDQERYLGKWYEIARLDHSFERGLSHVSAEYSLRDDGGIRVVNRGFSAAKGRWQDAEGKAFFIEIPDVAHLKVSFFGPFYGSYIVFELDKENYTHAFIAGANHNYLWFLSRSKTVTPQLKAHFLATAQAKGFDTEKLIFPSHDDQLAELPIAPSESH